MILFLTSHTNVFTSSFFPLIRPTSPLKTGTEGGLYTAIDGLLASRLLGHRSCGRPSV
ncbi:hypothetical protein BGW80DRAFT_1362004 [Lactifluus volemus]|nr:hypothetical protein BGW80DRAFT_1362004 [Lactifluus volemus]